MKSNATGLNNFKKENAYMWLEYEDGIVKVQYKPDLLLNLEDARKIVAYRLELLGDKEYPVLIRSSRLKKLEKEARQYFFTEGMVNFKAMAFLEKSAIEKMLSALIFSLNRPKIPHKVFSDEAEAIKWLEQFI